MTERLILSGDNNHSLPESKDIKIVQDTKILQQILKTIPGDVKNQINVIMVNDINNRDEDFDFMKLLQSLPEPRIRNLKKLAIKTSLRFFNRKVDVVKFLGINKQLLSPGYRDDQTKCFLEGEENDLY